MRLAFIRLLFHAAIAAARRLILGDIILSIDGKRINSASDLYRILDKCRVGDTVGWQGRRAATVPWQLGEGVARCGCFCGR